VSLSSERLSHTISFLLLFSCLIEGAWASVPTIWNEFSQNQRELLIAGKSVVTEEDTPDSAWPRVTVAYLIDCSPAEAASVFWNSELDPNYVPDCISARIISRPSLNVHVAEFRLRMPFFLPEEVYVSRVVLTRIHTGGYEITWSVNQSIYAKSCRGSVLIEPHDGKTLLIDRNLVIPKGDFAGFLRFPAVLRQKESVHALVRQILLEKAQHHELLARQQKALNLALGELEK
jgi:hypothetical protein